MADNSQRLVFAGTPDFAAHHLQALLAAGHLPVAVYTQPDRPAGRGKKLTASPVKRVALEAGIPVYQPASLRDPAEQQRLATLAPDIMVVVAYGLILPQAILDTPIHGCLNVHASLLPRWRGAAPIQRAIEAGDAQTGVTIMQMDAGLDTGAMLTSARCPIGPATNAGELHQTLAELGAPALLHVLAELPRFQAQATLQPEEGANYAAKIDKREAALDWSQDCTVLDRRIRAFNPFPVCFTELSGERMKVWRAGPLSGQQSGQAPGTIVAADPEGVRVQCGSGQLLLTQLQLPGGRPLQAREILNARSDSFSPGTRLGSPQPADA